MRRLLAAIPGLVCVCLLAAGAQESAAPRLVVVLVLDQFRADYLTTFSHRWQSGLRVLLNDGAGFPNARFSYWSTMTCAGHATIASGTLPRTHGLILNRWWHRDERRTFACTDDETAPAIGYGRPARFGHSAKRLLAPSLGDELKAQRPGARVVSLSLKPRSAIALAGRGGDAVVWFDEAAGTFVTSRAFASEPVPAVEAFVRRDSFEREAAKVWALSDQDRSYRFPDVTIGERPNAGWTSLFPHPIGGFTPPDPRFIDRWQKSPFSDAYLGRMAMALVDEWGLGQRASTDFLGVSFSALDMVGHDFGPRSREVEDLLIHLDRVVGAFIEHLDARVGRDRYVLAVTSDHGIAGIPEQVSGGGRIANEDIEDVVEQSLVGHWGPRDRSAYVDAALYGHVYFAPGVLARVRASPQAARAVDRALLAMPGVLRVVWSDELTASVADPVLRALAQGYVPGRSGDLIVVPRRDWIIELRSDDDATTHGTMYDYDRHVPLFLFGRGIRAGRFTQAAAPADIAPTLAHIAGLRLPKAEGRVLREALR